MAVSIWDLPYDVNGAPLGKWRLTYKDAVNTGMAGHMFVDGVCVDPIAGLELRHLVAATGSSLTVEPWDAQAAEEIRAKAPSWNDPAGLFAGVDATPAAPGPEMETEEPAPESDDAYEIDSMSKADLRQLADDIGLEVDGRWGEERLREAVRSAVED